MKSSPLFFLLVVIYFIGCQNNIPQGARFISENDTMFPADIRSISAKINQNPQTPENYYLRANAFYYLNNFKEASTDYLTAISLQPDNALYHFRLSECYLNSDSAIYEEAITHLNEAIKLKPNLNDAKFSLAKVLLARQQYKESEELLMRLSKQPEFKEKSLMLMVVAKKEQKDTLSAVQFVDKVMLEFPESFDATMQKALFLLNSDLQLAEKYVDKAIVINEFSDEAIYTKALILQRNNKYADALKLYDKVLKINPLHVYAIYNKAVINAQFDNHKNVIDLCDKMIELNPIFSKAFTLRGFAQINLGNKKAAKQDLQAALKLNPQDQIAKRELELLN